MTAVAGTTGRMTARDNRDRGATVVPREQFGTHRPVQSVRAPVSGEVVAAQPIVSGVAVLPSQGDWRARAKPVDAAPRAPSRGEPVATPRPSSPLAPAPSLSTSKPVAAPTPAPAYPAAAPTAKPTTLRCAAETDGTRDARKAGSDAARREARASAAQPVAEARPPPAPAVEKPVPAQPVHPVSKPSPACAAGAEKPARPARPRSRRPHAARTGRPERSPRKPRWKSPRTGRAEQRAGRRADGSLPRMPTVRSYWPLAIAGAAILAVTMGIRQSLGLFVSPLNTSTGLGIVTISFTLAVGQFVWGAAQPVFGAIADRAGPVRVMMAGRGAARARARGSRRSCIRASAWSSSSASSPRPAPAPAAFRSSSAPRPAPAAGAPRLRLGIHQRRRLLRPVRVRAAVAGADRGLRLGRRAAGAGRRGPRDHSDGAAAFARQARRSAARRARAGHQPVGPDRRGVPRPQLPVPARGLLHLRLPHRLPRDAPAGRGGAVRPARLGVGGVARDHRPRQHRRQPRRRLAGADATA